MIVMAGLVPAIHDLLLFAKDVDARHKAGHDECYFTSSGSVPTGLPAASSVIFSTRASA